MAGSQVIFNSQLATGNSLTLRGLAMHTMSKPCRAYCQEAYIWKGILPKKQAEHSLHEELPHSQIQAPQKTLKPEKLALLLRFSCL